LCKIEREMVESPKATQLKRERMRELAAYLVSYYVHNENPRLRRALGDKVQTLSTMVRKMMPVVKCLAIEDQRFLEGMPTTVEGVFKRVAARDATYLLRLDHVVFNLYGSDE